MVSQQEENFNYFPSKPFLDKSDPGWNNTRMGGPDARLRPVDTVAGMRRIIDQFEMRHTGKFLRFDGTEIPW